MLKVLKVPSLFQKTFAKNHLVKTKNYQTFFPQFLSSNSKIFDATRKIYIQKEFVLINVNHVTIANLLPGLK